MIEKFIELFEIFFISEKMNINYFFFSPFDLVSSSVEF